MKNILFVLTFCISSFVIAQESAPPPPAEPTPENKILIDELIKVTEYENYFNNYCKNKVEQAAQEGNWNEKRKKEIIESIKFKYFNNAIYNAFASDSKENLNQAIVLFKNLNSQRSDHILKTVPMNAMLQFNLDGFVKSLLHGKYMVSSY
ncbi:hypothetical protein MKS83_17465 [Chryseobacterium sp. Y16C]|uniref:hypothetical protein n=1 Tax=Chryseobacterium sp. Y16C TaxID=2920939 RepID=UPI001F0A7A6C|nr:hypothetical protein [Chryseobacterium sp. Y16C]UMQ41178.1 hypothetical protein MKS83_17465 [Chryseobacterium sp. Y16C]